MSPEVAGSLVPKLAKKLWSKEPRRRYLAAWAIGQINGAPFGEGALGDEPDEAVVRKAQSWWKAGGQDMDWPSATALSH